MYEDILLTTDGSEEAEAAVENAESLAEKYEAQIHVLYISDLRAQMGNPTMEFVVDNLEEAGQEAVNSVAEQLPDSAEAVTEVRTDIPHREIIEYSGEEEIDLICVSTHGRSGLDRLMIGSVTEKVLRKSDLPEMTVPINSED